MHHFEVNTQLWVVIGWNQHSSLTEFYLTGLRVCLTQIFAVERYQYCSLQTRWICRTPCLLLRSRRCCVWRASKTNPGTSGKLLDKTGFRLSPNHLQWLICPVPVATRFTLTKQKGKRLTPSRITVALLPDSFCVKGKQKKKKKWAELRGMLSHHQLQHFVLPDLQFRLKLIQ